MSELIELPTTNRIYHVFELIGIQKYVHKVNNGHVRYHINGNVISVIEFERFYELYINPVDTDKPYFKHGDIARFTNLKKVVFEIRNFVRSIL